MNWLAPFADLSARYGRPVALAGVAGVVLALGALAVKVART